MPDYDNDLNPQIMEIKVGTRNLRKIKIYPLSMHDQLELNDVISKAVSEFFKIDMGNQEESTLAFITFIIATVRENLSRFLGYITDDSESLDKELTNEQTMEICQIIYEQNYENLSKKVKNLLPKGTESPTGKLLRRAVPNTATP